MHSPEEGKYGRALPVLLCQTVLEYLTGAKPEIKLKEQRLQRKRIPVFMYTMVLFVEILKKC